MYPPSSKTLWMLCVLASDCRRTPRSTIPDTSPVGVNAGRESLVTGLCDLEELRWRHVEGLCQLENVVDADVPLASLQARDVCPMKPRTLSKLLLRELPLLSELADPASPGRSCRWWSQCCVGDHDDATLGELQTMRLQTMSNILEVPEELHVGRGDPVYMAHAYLTKVPVSAIMPFIEAYTHPGDIVLDLFAGSGMTGVAAAALGRRACLFDISVLGRHIGSNYVKLAEADLLRKHAAEVVEAVRARLGDVYGVSCERCGEVAQLAKTIWSYQIACSGCGTTISYYRAMEAAGWSKRAMSCPYCGTSVGSKSPRVDEVPEVDYVRCLCASTQREQTAAAADGRVDLEALPYPRVEITPDRQMYKAQSLGRSGLTSIASFYSARNLAVLTVLQEQIKAVADDALQQKLLFAFTASLTRASKRYQWSPIRPLNAANANYYIAPVYYEWNVFDLFLRKVEAAIRSDEWLRSQLSAQVGSTSRSGQPEVTYELASAEALPLADGSVDYVFTDPPFGSNLFYADMALFQEAWLDDFTDAHLEAVVDRGGRKQRSASRYEGLLTRALAECRRVLRPGGRISLVFGNSNGQMWSLLQRAIRNAGLMIEPDRLVVLNKGQRSVKGLASGFEHVTTLDLIITMTVATSKLPDLVAPSPAAVAVISRRLPHGTAVTPSHVYLELLRHGMRENWDLSHLDLHSVTSTLQADDWEVDERSGHLRRR